MQRTPYLNVQEAYADVDEVFAEDGFNTHEYAELIQWVRFIVQKAYRSGVEHGLAIGSRNADANASDTFARGFIEGEKHAVAMADAMGRFVAAGLEGVSEE